ncbi:DUF992 domain-containing protein [Rhodobacteraceae bacterium NNCM2]|nr:DUF992 domain-containing protein [Coraliihabitans acroporae]
MKKLLLSSIIATGIFAGPAFAQSGAEIGKLTCKVEDVSNVVVYTKETFDCTFERADGTTEKYDGVIKSYGVNLSIKEDFTIVWGVIAPTDVAKAPESLAGTYSGVGADVALAVGVGAKVLVGKGENSFTLQPVSVAGVTGGGASLGVEQFVLTPAS